MEDTSTAQNTSNANKVLSTANIGVAQILQTSDRTLSIKWTDGRKQLFDVVELRRQCPCAKCIDENTGRKLLDPKSISEEIRPVSINSVGRYALTISFTDGHKTGIYTFEKLRN